MEIDTEKLKDRLREEIYVKICEGQSCRPLHPTTDVWARMHSKDVIELRMGWTFPPNGLYCEEDNPFDPSFIDNWINGLGITVETAWVSLKREAEQMAESYWV